MEFSQSKGILLHFQSVKIYSLLTDRDIAIKTMNIIFLCSYGFYKIVILNLVFTRNKSSYDSNSQAQKSITSITLRIILFLMGLISTGSIQQWGKD